MISKLDQIQPIDRMFSAKQENPVYGEDGNYGSFAQVFESAINYVKETDAEKTEAEYLLSTGQLDNPAALTIATTKSAIAVDLLVQLRNKALDAYSEITRISM